LYILCMIVPLDIRFNRHYQRSITYLFFFTNGLALAANVADFIYYQFTLRRTTADVFLQFQNETNMAGLWIKFFIDYWYAVLFWILLMVLLISVFNRTHLSGPQLKNKAVYY